MVDLSQKASNRIFFLGGIDKKIILLCNVHKSYTQDNLNLNLYIHTLLSCGVVPSSYGVVWWCK